MAHRLLVLAVFAACTGSTGSPPSGDGTTEPVVDTGTAPDPTCADADCDGVCGGSATLDACGVCDDDAGNDCVVTASMSGGWICPIGVSCQDVYAVELTAGATVDLDVDGVHGESVIRLAVFPPGVALDGDNTLVGVSRDLACGAPDGGDTRSFVADVAGTWRVAVGRDAGASTGAGGSYTLTVTSTGGVGLTGPDSDDLPTEAPEQARCGSEYTFDSGWTCAVSGSCQDTFAVDLPAGIALELSALDVTRDSVSRFALHGPGVDPGGLNLLTNSTNDRLCAGQNEDDVLPPFVVSEAGVHTVAVTRDWGNSSGISGKYVLVVAGDDFFPRPVSVLDDAESLAPSKQCDWTFPVAGGWSCPDGVSCQDVFDVVVPVGALLSTDVTDVTGGSVVRLAAFSPGESLSGTNLITGSADDLSCGRIDSWSSFEPIAATTAGAYRIAIGRDAETSDGTSGTYEAVLHVENGFGVVSQTIDDQPTESTGTTCL